MKALLLGSALLASAVAVAGNAKGGWEKTNPYSSKLPEPVTTMAVSGLNIRLGTGLERLTVLTGEGHAGKKAAGAVLAVGLTLLGGAAGTDTASREPLREHFFEDDARRIGAEIAESIQQHLAVPGVTLVPMEQVAEVAALRGPKISHELTDDTINIKGGRFKGDRYYGYYMVPVAPYGFRARPKLGFTIGDGDVAPAVRAAAGAQAALNVDVFLVNTRKAMQVQEFKVEVLTPQMIGRGRDTPVFVFDLPEGALSVPLAGEGHKDNYATWQQMRPQFDGRLAELGAQIRAALDKGR